MSLAEFGKQVSKAVATSVVDEALKTPIREGADIVGQLFNLAASDRSPGALGRGKSFEIEEGVGATKRRRPDPASFDPLEGKFERMMDVDKTIKRDINKKQQYGISAGLGEGIYENMLTDTSRTYGKGKDDVLQGQPSDYFAAQTRYMNPGGTVKKQYLQALGIPDSSIQAYKDSKGTNLPGYRDVPTIREDDFSLQVSAEKSSENPLLNWAYKNPEAIGQGITYGAPIAGIAGAGLATYFATKPRSDYALGLGPSTGNSNIDAARASAHYQQETAQMKFEHQMQLQQARQQAQTPGRQNYGKALGLGLPDTVGGDGAREAYNMATSIIGATTPIYK
jgi:hypothetical protein